MKDLTPEQRAALGIASDAVIEWNGLSWHAPASLEGTGSVKSTLVGAAASLLSLFDQSAVERPRVDVAVVERHAGPLEVRSAGSVFRIETGDAQITTIGPADRIVRDGDRAVVVDSRGAEPILVSVAGDLGIGLLQFQGGGLGNIGIVQVANEAP